MDEAVAGRYWCRMCHQVVNPIVEVEIKCPFCRSGFIEELSSTTSRDNQSQVDTDADTDFGSDRALSSGAPTLLGMMGGQTRRRRRRFRQIELDFGEEDDDHDNDNEDGRGHGHLGVGETELDRELESIMRRRRRSSATILQLLQGIRPGMASELSENSEVERDRERDGHLGVGETELDRELESIMRRRRGSSATIRQLLQGIRTGMAPELSENSEVERDRERDGERDRDRDRQR